MLDCAIYVRVSSDKQVKKGYSLEAQEKVGIEVCKKNGWSFEVFREEGKSANKETIEHRPQLKRLIALAEEGSIQYCFASELDRLSRNPVSLALIKKVFAENDIKVVTTNQTYDFKDDEDDFITDLLGILAKRENKLRVKRSIRAKLEAFIKGKWVFTFPSFGYEKNKEGRLAINEEEKNIYLMMVDWALQGIGTGEIARKLSIMGVKTRGSQKYSKGKFYNWHSGSVLRILKHTTYKGCFTHKGNEVETPAIITPETWNRVQASLKAHYNSAIRHTRRLYLLRGLLTCKKCGKRLYGLIKPSRGMRCYCCLSKRPDPFKRFCGLKNIPLDKLNNLVWERVKELIKNSKLIKQLLEKNRIMGQAGDVLLGVQKDKLEQAIEQKGEEISNLLRLYGKSKSLSVKELDEGIEKVKDEKVELEEQLEAVNSGIRDMATSKDNMLKVEGMMQRLSRKINRFNDQEKYDLLHLIINKIIIDYDKDRGHSIEIELGIPIVDNIKQAKNAPMITSKMPMMAI